MRSDRVRYYFEIMLSFYRAALRNLIFFLSLTLLLFSGCAASPAGRLFTIHYDASLPRASIAIIIPGLGQSASSPGYDAVGAFYRGRGITPVFVNMNWKAAGVSRLGLAGMELDTMLHDSFPGARVYLFGFSFGAVVALEAARSVPAAHILLCSMSPLYREDRAFQIFPFRQLMGLFVPGDLSYAPNLGQCVTFLYADQDNFVISKAIIGHRKASFTCNETIIIDHARHDISGRSYLDTIRAIVQRIGG